MIGQRTKRALAALATTAIIASGCGSGDETETAATSTVAEAAATTEALATTTEAPAAAEPAGDLKEGPLDAGTYATSELGTSLEVTISDGMVGEFVEPGLVMIADSARVNQVTESVAFFRATGFADETEVEVINTGGAYSGPADDLDAWAAAVGEVEVTAAGDVDINGVTATVATVIVTDGAAGRPGGCGPTAEDRCFNIATTGAASIPSFIVRTSEIYRVWVFDQGSETPLVAMAFADATNEAWLDEVAAPMVESAVLGDPQPHPVDQSIVAGDDGVLDFAFMPIEPGEYAVDTMGTPFTIDIGENWWVQPNDETGFLVLTDPESQGPGDDDIVFVRAKALTDPATPSAPTDEQSGEWPLGDIEGWVNELPETVLISNQIETTFSEMPAVQFDVELADEVECGPEFCVGFAANNPPFGKSFDPGFVYRVIWVDQDPYEPIAIIIGTGDAASNWFATAEALLATIELGDPAPHPLPEGDLWEFGLDADVPAGPVMIPAFGGLGFELDEPAFLVQPSGAAIFILDGPGEVNVIQPFANRDGDPVDTPDAFTAVLDDLGVTWNETDGATVLGVEARGIDVTDAPAPDFSQGPPITTDEEGFGGWGPPNSGRFYLAETERGFFLVGAESYEDDSLLAAAIALQDDLLAELEFIEFTAE